MGQLITRDNFIPDPSWFFEDARYDFYSRGWTYTWPSKNYAHSVAIHNDILRCLLKVKIREWVEINITGSVIFEMIDKSYQVYWDDTNIDCSFERDNRWVVFYMVHSQDVTMFRLQFSEYVSEISDLHPTEEFEYEKTSHSKKNR